LGRFRPQTGSSARECVGESWRKKIGHTIFLAGLVPCMAIPITLMSIIVPLQ
jgi:hypothetical protein